jgi:hypothetical protein
MFLRPIVLQFLLFNSQCPTIASKQDFDPRIDSQTPSSRPRARLQSLLAITNQPLPSSPLSLWSDCIFLVSLRGSASVPRFEVSLL